MAHVLKLQIEVTLERTEGKFASRSEMAEALVNELEGMDPGSLYGLGANSESTYDITDWSVSSDD
jgi:hypothetical protein